MATIFYLDMKPVFKAGTTVARSAHHSADRLCHTDKKVRVNHGAAGKSAYISAERTVGKDGLVTDYRGKEEVEESLGLRFPGGKQGDKEKFWNAIDSHWSQKETACIARDVIINIPYQLNKEQRRDCVDKFTESIRDRFGVATDAAIHMPVVARGSDPRNYHAHILFSERKISTDGEIGLVNRELNHLVCQKIDDARGRTAPRATAAEVLRKDWQRIVNDALEKAGILERIDCRSYKAQGIDKTPGKHLGKQATDAKRAAAKTMTVAAARAEMAAMKSDLQKRIEIAKRTIDDIQDRRLSQTSVIIDQRIGSWEEWKNDTVKTFFRVMESADRADARRRGMSRYRQLRHATPEETEALKLAGRTIRRSEKLCGRLVEIEKTACAKKADAKLKIEPSRQKNRNRINEIEDALK